MAKLTPEKRAELEALLAADDETGDDDFEIEIRDGDKAARVPYSKGRAYLQKHFGIDLDPEPEPEPEPEPKAGKPAGKSGEVRAFGRRVG
jgi:hypothetical protein